MTDKPEPKYQGIIEIFKAVSKPRAPEVIIEAQIDHLERTGQLRPWSAAAEVAFLGRKSHE